MRRVRKYDNENKKGGVFILMHHADIGAFSNRRKG
jgi:hypothetical protein